jgi:hypothetical protein
MSGFTEVIWTDQNRTAGQPPDLDGGAVTLTCMHSGAKDRFHLTAADDSNVAHFHADWV